jgi:ABC-2 type transport system permease protein
VSLSRSHIVSLWIKETIQILRDWRALALSIGLPLMLLLLFGFGVSLDVTRIGLAVCDRDNTAASRALIRRFLASGYFTDAVRILRDEEIERVLAASEAQAALVVPAGYGRAVARYQPVAVQLIIDGTDSNAATVVRSHALTLFQDTAVELLQARLTGGSIPWQRRHRAEEMLALDVRSRVLYNPNLRSRDYFVPGLIGILMTMIGVLLPAISIVREEELGTLEALRVSPLGPWELVIGKLGPYVCISVLDLALVLLAGHFLFDLHIQGSVDALAIGSGLLLVAALGLGLLISSLARSQQSAMATAFILAILPVIYLSDFIFTLRSVPRWLQMVSYLVPARYYLVILRGVVQKGVGVASLMPSITALAIYAAVLLACGAIGIRRKIA